MTSTLPNLSGAARTYRNGVRLVRRSHEFATMAGGWLMAELPPHVLLAQTISAMSAGTPGPLGPLAQQVAAQRAGRVLSAVLRDGFGADYADQVRHPISPTTDRRAPGLNTVLRYRGRYTAGTADIGYGGDADAGPAHQLDIWRRPDLPADTAAPVLLHIPGGAWSINDKRGQGYSLMRALAERGWICVSINYRRSPHHPWPAHLMDVKRAIGWVKENIAEYGGDPEFVAVTGGSAGGHLSALAALTANDPMLQPGFEDVDTVVAAAVPMYGVFDLTDAGLMHPKMMAFLERQVFQEPLADNRAAFEQASPVHHISADAPPFFLLHGQKDSIVPAAQSKVFSAALRAAGAETVLHAELPNAHHMFDAVGSVRSHLVAEAAADFLGVIYGKHVAAGMAARSAG